MLFFFTSERVAYPLSFDGGAETSVYTVIDALAARGIENMQLSTLPASYVADNYRQIVSRNGLSLSENDEQFTVSGIELAVPRPNVVLQKKGLSIIFVAPRYFYHCCSFFLQKLNPRIAVSFLNGSESIQKIIASNSIRSAHWAFGIDETNLPPISSSVTVLANSLITAAVCERTYSRLVHYLPSMVKPEHYLVADREPEYVTLINPRIEKGLNLFCNFCRMLPNIPFLVVLGWTQSKYEEQEKRALDFLRSLHNVKFTGPLSDMKQVYTKTKILVVPSRWMETFGRVVIEAQLNKIPVVASNRGNLPLTVGLGGLILPYGSPELWARALRSLYFNEQLIDTLAQKAFENACRYNDSKVPDKICEIFHSINGSIGTGIGHELPDSRQFYNVSDTSEFDYSISTFDLMSQLTQVEPQMQ